MNRPANESALRTDEHQRAALTSLLSIVEHTHVTNQPASTSLRQDPLAELARLMGKKDPLAEFSRVHQRGERELQNHHDASLEFARCFLGSDSRCDYVPDPIKDAFFKRPFFDDSEFVAERLTRILRRRYSRLT